MLLPGNKGETTPHHKVDPLKTGDFEVGGHFLRKFNLLRDCETAFPD